MNTKYIISALLAAGLATLAHAGTVTSTVPDLTLGFQDVTDGTSNDYEVNLGSIANFQGLAAGSVVNLSGDISATDLTNIFGSGWNTGGNVTWGAAATTGAGALAGQPAETSWVTQFDSVSNGVTNLSASALPASFTQQESKTGGGNTRYLDIQAVNNFLNNKTASTNTATANTAVTSILATTTGSWSKFVNNAANGWGSTPIDSGTGLSLSAGQYSVIDLFNYQIDGTNGPGTYLGSLELGSNGTLDFTTATAAAIPEPSTYAAILGVASLGVVLIRRRKQQVIA
jgi:hypothetical protein